jgi:GPH family glycoside/pentoside/hexuronide:cation symporter
VNTLAAAPAWRGGWTQGLPYGALGLPLAFVALPLYVVLPNHYASEFGIPLATLGAMLLGARLLDALADPLIGRWADGWLSHSARRVLIVAALAAVLLALGFRGLFFPPVTGGAALLAWCAALLALTYLSYSVLTVLHQAWGARLGGGEDQRARIVAWREGLALVGVLVASVLPSVAGLSVTSAVFAMALLLAVALLGAAPRPQLGARAGAGAQPAGAAAHPGLQATAGDLSRQWRGQRGAGHPGALFHPRPTPGAELRAAVPGQLLCRGRLEHAAVGAGRGTLWLGRSWLAGMLLAVLTFAWASALGAGDVVAFTVVCLASGVALGADLSLPGALLAGVIQRAGHGQQLEGAYFGWWNFCTKLNLALAAGLALPLLGLAGYAPGARDPQALQALTLAYCLLPCFLKLLAAALLWRLWLVPETSR